MVAQPRVCVRGSRCVCFGQDHVICDKVSEFNDLPGALRHKIKHLAFNRPHGNLTLSGLPSILSLQGRRLPASCSVVGIGSTGLVCLR